MKRTFFILLSLWAGPLLPGFSADRILMDSGHNSSVDALAIQQSSGHLLSADNTGVVKVWNLESDKLEYQLDTGAGGAVDIRVHPVKSEVAILVNQPGDCRLSVWNWKSGRNIFTKKLRNSPIQFAYSGKGRYIFITQVDNPGMVLISSKDGRVYSYLKRLKKLFSFGYIGSRETTVMTYSNSGLLAYYDIKTSSLKGEIETRAELSELQVLQSSGKRYIAARKEQDILLIDRLNGSVTDSYATEGGIACWSADTINGTLILMEKKGNGRYALTFLKTRQGHFIPIPASSYLSDNPLEASPEESHPSSELTFRLANSPRSFICGMNRLFFSNPEGQIWQIDPAIQKPGIFKKNEVSPIQDLAFLKDKLLILTEDTLFTLDSQFFRKAQPHTLNSLGDITMNTQASPLPGNSFLKFYNEEEVLLWTKDNGIHPYVLFHPESGKIKAKGKACQTSLKDLKLLGTQVLTLESSGEASLSDIHSGKRLFSFSALGMTSLDFIDRHTLLAGKSLVQNAQNPLLTINTLTGEILPVKDSRFIIDNIQSTLKSQYIYASGLLLKSDGTVETRITKCSKKDLNRSTTVYKRKGEWLNTIIKMNQESKNPEIYGSMTGRDIFRIRQNRRKNWDYDKNIQNIFYHSGVIYIINTDGSLSLFSPASGRKILDFYLLNKEEWIAIPADGSPPVVNALETGERINTFSSSPSGRFKARIKVLPPGNHQD